MEGSSAKKALKTCVRRRSLGSVSRSAISTLMCLTKREGQHSKERMFFACSAPPNQDQSIPSRSINEGSCIDDNVHATAHNPGLSMNSTHLFRSECSLHAQRHLIKTSLYPAVRSMRAHASTITSTQLHITPDYR